MRSIEADLDKKKKSQNNEEFEENPWLFSNNCDNSKPVIETWFDNHKNKIMRLIINADF